MSGTVTLYIHDKPYVTLTYSTRGERAKIIARWAEEFAGTVTYSISPALADERKSERQLSDYHRIKKIA